MAASPTGGASRQLIELLQLASEAELEAELEAQQESAKGTSFSLGNHCRRRLQLDSDLDDESAQASQVSLSIECGHGDTALTPRQHKATARTASTSIGEGDPTRSNSLTNLLEEGQGQEEHQADGRLVWLEGLQKEDLQKLQACPTPSEARVLLAKIAASSESAEIGEHLLAESADGAPGGGCELDEDLGQNQSLHTVVDTGEHSANRGVARERMATTSFSSSSAISSSSSSSLSLLSLLPSPLTSLSPSPQREASPDPFEVRQATRPTLLPLPLQLEVPKDLVQDLESEEASEQRREAALRRDLEQELLLQEARLKVMKEEHERSCKEMRLQLFAEVARQQEQCALQRMRHAILPLVK